MPALTRTCSLALLAISCLYGSLVAAADRQFQGPYFDNDRLRIVLIPRTPEQMAAFYEARGFPPEALERIRQTCFITVHIENKGDEVLWLELENWQFSSGNRPLARLDQAYWQSQWDAIELPQSKRSTFGWTQLPPVRDLQPAEPVGGNVVLPGTVSSVNIEAVFHSGADRQGETIRLGFGQVPCSKGVQP